MERNIDTVNKIRNFVTPILSGQAGKDFTTVSLKDISIDDGMKIADAPLSDSAMRTVLRTLNIKPQFLDFRENLSPQDWALIGKKLKEARGDVDMFANIINPNDPTKSEVLSLVLKNPKKKISDVNTTSSSVIDLIENSLLSSEVNFSVNGMGFNEKNNLFSIDLINEDFQFEPFKGDMWKKGESFNFNSVVFRNMPMLERLSCTNGMTTKNFGFASNIGQTRFNENKIEAEIRKSLLKDNNNVHEMIDAMLKRLKKTNISVAEFFAWKNQFKRFGEDYKVIADKYFNEAPLFAAYKTDLDKKPEIWKKTADTGINAYNFLNLVTWIASHPDESGVSKEKGDSLKISAGNYLFKKNFDLERIAEKVDVDYPVLAEMQ